VVIFRKNQRIHTPHCVTAAQPCSPAPHSPTLGWVPQASILKPGNHERGQLSFAPGDAVRRPAHGLVYFGTTSNVIDWAG
jgi:hypothetical protein